MPKIVSVNKRAYFDFEVLETVVSGISLTGGEVKSAKAGNVSLKEGFVRVRKGEAFLINIYIAPYQRPRVSEDETVRTRKLLLHRKEIEYLESKMHSGLTLVPLRFLIERGLVKLEIGIARGKKKYDKREILKKRAVERDVQMALKERGRE